MKNFKKGQLIRIKCNSITLNDTGQQILTKTDEKCIGRIISPFRDTPRMEILFSTVGCNGTCLLFTKDRVTKVTRLSKKEITSIMKNKLMGTNNS